jgi:hypothetical protein
MRLMPIIFVNFCNILLKSHILEAVNIMIKKLLSNTCIIFVISTDPLNNRGLYPLEPDTCFTDIE